MSRKFQNWEASILFAPKPNRYELRVSGQVSVLNPGEHATLRRRVPQGINPDILMLDLFMVPVSGDSTKPGAWTNPTYSEDVPNNSKLKFVEIYEDRSLVQRIEVEHPKKGP